jgi:hypothetical protein
MLRPYGEFVISSAARNLSSLPQTPSRQKAQGKISPFSRNDKRQSFFASFAVKFFFSLVARVPAETFSATSLLSFDP